MNETAVKRIDRYNSDRWSSWVLVLILREPLFTRGFSREIADRTGDDGHVMTLSGQVVSQLGMASATRLIKIRKSLVDQEDMHALILSYSVRLCWQAPVGADLHGKRTLCGQVDRQSRFLETIGRRMPAPGGIGYVGIGERFTGSIYIQADRFLIYSTGCEA